MRYLPLSDTDRQAMLATIGADSVDDLFVDVPAAARRSGTVDLPAYAGELEVEAQLSAFAAKNLSPSRAPFFVGAGAYRHHIPATVDHIMLMAQRVTKRNKAVLSGGLHPHYRETIETLAHAVGMATDAMPLAVDAEADTLGHIDADTACVVVQTPNLFGTATDVTKIAAAAQAAGALLIVVTTEVMSLGLLKSPGEMGADVVAVEGQSIGVPLSFGGPYVGLFAAKEKYLRNMPGRLCGETVDADGARGFVLTLSTREQHIRRDKATSNICTNSGLCALAFSIHMSLLGQEGLKRVAKINYAKAHALRDHLISLNGVECVTPRFFNEFTLKLPSAAAPVVEALAARGILGGVPVSRLDSDTAFANHLIVAATETNTDADIATFVSALKEVLS